jgi:hypothetical protein
MKPLPILLTTAAVILAVYAFGVGLYALHASGNLYADPVSHLWSGR